MLKAVLALTTLIVFCSLGYFSPPSEALSPAAAETIRAKLTETGGALQSPLKVEHFYRNRDFAPAWADEEGLRRLPINVLLKAILDSKKEGLNPEFYRLGEMKGLLSKIKKTPPGRVHIEDISDLDIMLTDAFLTYGSDLFSGRVSSDMVPRDRADEETDVISVLEGAIEACLEGRCPIIDALGSLRPPHPAYSLLKDALGSFRRMPDWPRVPAGAPLRRGARGPRVATLKKRLAATGDYRGTENGVFDGATFAAVRKFQLRHGLEPDGVVGRQTLAALKVPRSKRIRQIEINMERWRWFPRRLADRFIVINSANFKLQAVEDGLPALEMKVVVGRPFWHTPDFSAKMTHLVLNPAWHIPPSIVEEEIMPKIIEDPAYLSANEIDVFSGGEKIEPEEIDWPEVPPEDLEGMKFVQRPGPQNALGRVKFMFPNDDYVYFHDTTEPELFEKTVRTFSHGCIRIEKPVELAEYVLGGALSREEITAEIEKGREKRVTLPEPIDVHLFYWTAWVEDDGTLNFRDDVYERDWMLDSALR